MIAWVLKRSKEYDEDKDKDVESSVLHAYRKVKHPRRGVTPKTLCSSSIHWNSSIEDDAVAFSPAFPPGENDKACGICKDKAAKVT